MNGKLIKPGDLTAIKNSLDYYIENPKAVELHGKGSEELVKPFLPETVFNTLIDLYNKFAPSSKAASSISLAAKTNFKKGL